MKQESARSNLLSTLGHRIKQSMTYLNCC